MAQWVKNQVSMQWHGCNPWPWELPNSTYSQKKKKKIRLQSEEVSTIHVALIFPASLRSCPDNPW